MLSKNISQQNAFIRLACGIALVSFGTARVSRNSSCLMGKLMILGGAMKAAEGHYQYCPITAMVRAVETDGDEEYMLGSTEHSQL